MTITTVDAQRMEMLLDSAVTQVCTTIAVNYATPSPSVVKDIRDKLRVALLTAKLLGRVAPIPRHDPTREIDLPTEKK